jgi:hypothetical protein
MPNHLPKRDKGGLDRFSKAVRCYNSYLIPTKNSAIPFTRDDLQVLQ